MIGMPTGSWNLVGKWRWCDTILGMIVWMARMDGWMEHCRISFCMVNMGMGRMHFGSAQVTASYLGVRC